MSGGEFNYAFTKIDTFIEELKEKIKDVQKNYEIYDIAEKDKEKINQEFKFIKEYLETSSAIMHTTEWFFSDDIGSDEFLKRMKKIHKNIDKNLP
jgi:hypothetical protein